MADPVVQMFERLRDSATHEYNRLQDFYKMYEGDHPKPKFSAKAEEHFGVLWLESTVNYIPLLVNAIAQRAAVMGYRSSKTSDDDSAPWEIWQDNRMDSLQHALYAECGKYGYAYAMVTPSLSSGKASIRPMSPRTVYCEYADIMDEYPAAAVRMAKARPSDVVMTAATMWTPESVYTLTSEPSGNRWQVVDEQTNPYRVVPFVRYCNEVKIEDDGLPPKGEIQPLIKLQNQLNRVSFILNMVAERTAFKIKYMAGVDLPEENTFRQLPGELWNIIGDVSKIGEFSADDPSGLIAYRDKLLNDLFTIAQVPPSYANANISNVSADALAETEAIFEQKLGAFQDSMGESHESMLRLASLVAGDSAASQDTSSRIWWRDTSPRALAAAVDAAGKAVQMLGIPQEGAWEFLPNVTQQQIDRWKSMKEEEQANADFNDIAQGVVNANAANNPASVSSAPAGSQPASNERH